MPTSSSINPKWFVIVNPEAGGGGLRRSWSKLEPLLQQYLPSFELAFTEYSMHAKQLTQQGIKRGFRFILGIGGDGTNHEIVNGIMSQQETPSTDITYALLPIGTGNDWRRTYKIPNKPEKWLKELEQSKTVLQDVGKAYYQWEGENRERFFVNEAGLAYSGFIIQHAQQRPGGIRNKFGYLWAVVRCLFKYKLQKARITFDHQFVEKLCYTINIAICPFCGGGMRLAPHALPADGLLALTIAGSISKLGVLVNTHRLFNGHIGNHPKIDLHQVKNVEIESLDTIPIPLEADGEFLGYTPARFEIIPQALRVLVPA